MAVFNEGYWHTLDRDYERLNNLLAETNSDQRLAKPLLRISELGTSVAEGPNVGNQRLRQTVQAAISKGARKIELAISSTNIKTGPGSYSEEEKEELRGMARINQVEFFSVHAPTGSIENVSGLSQNRFSEQTRHQQIKEVEEAIDFASETSLGGAVVVHTGEFPRSLSRFKEFSEFANKDAKERIHHFLDKTTGEVKQNIREDHVNWDPYYEGKDGNPTLDKDKAKVDDFNTPILLQDQDENYIKYKKNWEYYEREAEEKNTTPQQLCFEDTMKTQIGEAKGHAHDFEARYERHKEELNARKRMFLQAGGTLEEFRKKNRVKIKEMNAQQDSMVNYQRKTTELETQRDNVVSIEKLARDRSVDSFAQLGIHAMDATRKAKKKYGKVENVRDIFVAPENIFPQMGYGSHPDELIELVNLSREEMARQLQKQHPSMSDEQAKNLSDRHIKATFDTEHLGMWEKHFIRDPKDTPEEHEKRFKDWYLGEIDKLAESGVLGHVHLADTLGIGHANLPAGAGKLPLRDAVRHLKEKGYEGTWESEGYGDPTKQESQAWAYFGSPIYAAGGEHQQRFNRIQQSAARAMTPYRTVTPPDYPSQDWKMWSEIPLD